MSVVGVYGKLFVLFSVSLYIASCRPDNKNVVEESGSASLRSGWNCKCEIVHMCAGLKHPDFVFAALQKARSMTKKVASRALDGRHCQMSLATA